MIAEHTGYCRLCGESKVLRRSHIIPEFLYAKLYDDLHRMLGISTKPSAKIELPQKGLRERLLCDSCESLLSGYETYAVDALSNPTVEGLSGGRGLVSLEGIDYSRYKIFQLSVLWRASISSLDFFTKVNLGEKHEKMIRGMIYSGTAGPLWRYGCMVFFLSSEESVVEQIIMQPEHFKFGKHHMYRFVLGGMVWVYIVSSHRATSRQGIYSKMITVSGELSTLKIPIEDLKFLTGAFQDFINAGIIEKASKLIPETE